MASPSARTPAISIVTATYNRSRALACAIESVRLQSFPDWEMIIVGDACTDDTAEVIQRVADPRIHFLNLGRNHGEQAGPNNIGVAETTAPLVAFLNHDDLWLPNHLQLCREALLAERADLVFGAMANLQPHVSQPFRFENMRFVLEGVFKDGRYSPGELDAGIVPASSWLVRRELLSRLRGWRLARDCFVEPSQDFLFRAWHAGYRVCPLNILSLIVIASGCRPGSYVDGRALEQEWFLERLGNAGFAAELTALGIPSYAIARPSWWVRKGAMQLARLGLNPRELDFRFRRRLARGERIAGFRKVRGLPPDAHLADGAAKLRFQMVRQSCAAKVGTIIDFAAGAGGARYLASGWSHPEAHGVWNDGDAASLLFDFGRPLKTNLAFDFSLRAFSVNGGEAQIVEVSSDQDDLRAVWTIDPEDVTHRRLLIAAARAKNSRVHIHFRFRNSASPRSLGLSDDRRKLGVTLVQVAIEPA